MNDFLMDIFLTTSMKFHFDNTVDVIGSLTIVSHKIVSDEHETDNKLEVLVANLVVWKLRKSNLWHSKKLH